MSDTALSAVVETKTEAPAEAPKVEAPAVVEAPKVEAAPVETKPVETKAPDAKPTEAKPAEPPKPAEAKPDTLLGEAPPPAEAPIVYEPFKAPEGVTFDNESIGKFSELMGAAHVPQEAAQKILDLYTNEIARITDVQKDVWNKTNEDWKSAIKADPEIGGNRLQTVLQTSRGLIERFGGSAEEKAAVRQALALTGAGNHPEVVRLFYRIGKALGEGSPVPAPTPKEAPGPKNRASARYGDMKG